MTRLDCTGLDSTIEIDGMFSNSDAPFSHTLLPMDLKEAFEQLEKEKFEVDRESDDIRKGFAELARIYKELRSRKASERKEEEIAAGKDMKGKSPLEKRERSKSKKPIPKSQLRTKPKVMHLPHHHRILREYVFILSVGILLLSNNISTVRFQLIYLYLSSDI